MSSHVEILAPGALIALIFQDGAFGVSVNHEDYGLINDLIPRLVGSQSDWMLGGDGGRKLW